MTNYSIKIVFTEVYNLVRNDNEFAVSVLVGCGRLSLRKRSTIIESPTMIKMNLCIKDVEFH